MSLSAGEQYLLELINRARLDPAAEAQRYGLGLNAGLAPGTIDADAKQVLAPNDKLEAAATRHSTWMLQTNSFSHTGAGGTDAGERMETAGYRFTGSWSWRENLAWVGTTGTIDMQAAIRQHHEGLYRSESHRVNTFAESIREIGIGQVAGTFDTQGNSYRSSMLTEKFAAAGDDVFVTGVAYRDADRDDFYSVGEGQGGVWIRGGGSSDSAAAAGGYAIAVNPQDTLRVAVGQGNTVLARVDIDTTQGNAKLDVVTAVDGSRSLDLSASATLVTGIADARLLGVADLDLRGHMGANELIGNTGDNHLEGLGGNDRLWGGQGNDRLDGGSGRDTLSGGDGADFLAGRDGADRLAGDRGNDQIWAGNGDDRADGGSGEDVLRGGTGHDWLMGRDGHDILLGEAGRDWLWGGNGRDRLDGGAGNDRLEGGQGADTFVFSGHRDTVVDFTDDVDTILIRQIVADDNRLSVAEVLDLGTVVQGNAIFDFGNGHVLNVMGVTDLSVLANDLVII